MTNVLLSVPIHFLGQAGFRFDFDGVIIFIDPYLSDYVEAMEGEALKRQRPAPFAPASVRDADYILITHGHMDHCDPETLLPMLLSSVNAKVIAPYCVIDFLIGLGMSSDRGIRVSENSIELNGHLTIISVPAAHPKIEKDAQNHLCCVGFVISYRGHTIYHSGDTSPDDYLIEALQRIGPINVALMPINEKNFYRDKAGIIGNMSIREAFGMAEDMAAKKFVPMHYDMFKANLVYLDELAVVYRELQPQFELMIEPTELLL